MAAVYANDGSGIGQGALRKTGVLKLPGISILREYLSATKPRVGFRPEVVTKVQRMAEKLDSNQCYVALLHDEMSIKSDLVFDSRRGELVGFMNKEKWTFCEG